MKGDHRTNATTSRSPAEARAVRRRRWAAALAWALAAGAPLGEAFAQGPGFGPQMMAVGPASGMPPMMPAGMTGAGMPVRTTALSTPDEKPLPPQVAALPQVQEELEVIHHRDQILVGRGRIVRTTIADNSIIEAIPYSENEIEIIGVALGSTTLSIWFENDPEPLIYLVTVIRDPALEERRRIDYGKLERKLRLLFPNSQVYLVPLSYKIVVKGQARDAEEAAQIINVIQGEVINQEGALPGPQPGGGGAGDGGAYVSQSFGGAGTAGFGNGPFGNIASSYIVNMLEVPGERQITIRVRIAELNRQQLRRMGVDIGLILSGGRNIFGSTLGGSPGNISAIINNAQVPVLVNWIATNGTGKILAEPVLTVMSGHPAQFLSGGEFAVPTVLNFGGGTIGGAGGLGGIGAATTTFRGFGTSLVVTPMIVDKDLIRMRIQPEYSQIDPSRTVGGIPGLNSRRLQTTVELREGQTIALAGLIGRKENTEVTRVPFLGDLPLVGPTVFAAKRATEDENELLILVTPEIVRPMEPDEVPPVPGYYVTHPSDCQLYFHGMTEGPPDLGVYQVGPIGRGATYGREVGYRVFEPAPATPLYSPSVPYPNGNVAPLQVPPTASGFGTPGQGMPAPAYGGQGFNSGFGNQGYGNPGYGGMSPPVPPSASDYPPMAPPAEPAGPMTPIHPRGMGPAPGMGTPQVPAGPVQGMPSPAFGVPTTQQRSFGDRLRSVIPAGFSRDENRNTPTGTAPQAAGWR